jgi:N-succinyldiaminopimelate aminotransferase
MNGAETSIFTRMTALAERTGAINLGQGFPDENGPAAVIDAAVAAMRAGHNQYAPLPGVAPLREAIAAHQLRHYGIELDPDSQIQVTFGATEALSSALIGLVRPGDEVAMLDPSYDAYAALVALAGGRPRPIVLGPPDWRVDGDALAAAIGPATRFLLLNSPHNPTGRVFDREELELLATACREHDLVAITDEVYEHLVYDGEHIPLATLDDMFDRTLTISSLGKTYSLTGWKTGWASGPGELVAAVRGVKQYLSFAGGTPLQHAAATALTLSAETDALAETLASKRDRLAAGLHAAGFAVLDSAGTYFLNADARTLGEHDAEALCARLPHEAGVVAIPIAAFCADPSPETRTLVRFAFCKRETVIDDAVERLRRWSASRTDGRIPRPVALPPQ